MSNESNSGTVNDPNRMSNEPKSGQQSQGTTPQTDKSGDQQGGSAQKSGQQSQGTSQKDSDEMKRAGSGNVSDQKTGNDAAQRPGSSK